MIPKLRNMSYEKRLKECGLTTLETRMLSVDQIEVFKILNGYEKIDRNIFFSVKEERRTRGHGVTLAKKQCRLDIFFKHFHKEQLTNGTDVYKIRITAGLTSVREVAALSSPTRIAFKLNKDTFLSNNAVL